MPQAERKRKRSESNPMGRGRVKDEIDRTNRDEARSLFGATTRRRAWNPRRLKPRNAASDGYCSREKTYMSNEKY